MTTRRRTTSTAFSAVRRPSMLVVLPETLGEVVADVAEDVLDLTAQEHHGDDDRDGDNGDDESVLDKTLALVVSEERQHPGSPFPENSLSLPKRRERARVCVRAAMGRRS